MTQTAPGILSAADAAAQLDTTELRVMRLLSRGRLRGTRLGERGLWMVEADSLAEYVRRGAGDFDPPGFDEPFNPHWFRSDYRWLADLFPEAVIEAAGEQVLTDARAQAMLDGNYLARTFDVQIRLTPAVVAALQRAIPPSRITPEPKGYPRGAWADLYLAEKLRNAAAGAIATGPYEKLLPPVRHLYGGPDKYRPIVDAAIRRVGQQRFVFSETRSLTLSVPGVSTPPQPVNVKFWYILPNSVWAGDAVMRRVADLAF